LGSRVRIPSPAPNKTSKNQDQSCSCGEVVPASISLNEPRTVPNCLADLGKRRAQRSRKVLKDTQKRSPASAATEHGTYRSKSKSSHPKITRPAAESQERGYHFFWITHGQTNAGFVEQIGDSYKAITADGVDIGVFDSLKAAADAVSDCEGVR
jgi:hypothetical protein